MSGSLRLLIATPLAIVVDAPRVAHVRAWDETGAFGLLPGHVDLVSATVLSVLSWRGVDGTMRYCAVRDGVLTLRGGREVHVATSEAVPGTDLDTLEHDVLERLRQHDAADRQSRQDARRLELVAVRRICAALRAVPGNGRVSVPHETHA